MKPRLEKKNDRMLMVKILSIIIAVFSSLPVLAQRDKEKLQKMIDEDPTTINAIAGYDENVRGDILQLAQTPEVLNILEDLQKKSQKRFRNIINDYDRDQQSALYEMARYPDLISALTKNGTPSSSEVSRIVLRYPTDIRPITEKYARSCYGALVQIDQLNDEIDKDFKSYLSPYDDQTRQSVGVLLKYPEIVSILVEDKDFTALLGATYREDPDWVMGQLNTIAQELEEKNQKDLADYKNQIQKDPEAYKEMLNAADQFATESSIDGEGGNEYADASADIDIHVIHSYPFWFGYPYWYPYAYWRPYPTYYHTGFYYGPGHNVIFVGLPSSHFIYWQTHYHPNLYPHLSYSYYSYYHNHYLPYRNQGHGAIAHSAFYRSVERNVVNNPRVNNDNLVRIDRMRGANIVERPSGFGSTGRRSSAVMRSDFNTNGRDFRGSARGNAFPRTTPATVNAPAVNQNGGSMNRGNINQNAPRGYLNSEKRANFQQREGAFRNYRNYTATEPRQVSPSSQRQAPQRVSPKSGIFRSGGNQGRANQSSGGFRESRKK